MLDEILEHDPSDAGPNPLWEVLRRAFADTSSAQELTDEETGVAINAVDMLPLQGDAFDAFDMIPGLPPGSSRVAKAGVGILGSLLPYARRIIKAGKHSEPLFHGVKEGAEGVKSIMQHGFKSDPEHIGKSFGSFLGEPAGVSLTGDPRQATLFGKSGWGTADEGIVQEGLMRVGLESPESSLAKFSDPEFKRSYKRSYEKAGEFDQIITPENVSFGEGMNPDLYDSKMADYLFYRKGSPGKHNFMDMVNQGNITTGDAESFLTKKMVREFNERLRRNLVDEGIEGIRYSPHRYNESEIRAFMDEKIHPFGTLDPNDPALFRWLWGDPKSATKAHDWSHRAGSALGEGYGGNLPGAHGKFGRRSGVLDPNATNDFSRLINDIGLNPHMDEIVGKGAAADIDKQIAAATEAFEESLDWETKMALAEGPHDEYKALKAILEDDLYK